MNLTRLMVLGTLASHGPQHGHQIRRTAEVTKVSEWGGVSVGALYRELRVMAGEGLVTELRTEQVGRRPARTVYEITDQGHLELNMLRERAIRDVRLTTDPVSVALAFSGTGPDPEEFAGWMRARRDVIEVGQREVAADRERLQARGHITPLVALVMRRSELAMDAELRWHEELARAMPLTWSGPGPAVRQSVAPGAAREAPDRPELASAEPHRPEPHRPEPDRPEPGSAEPGSAEPGSAEPGSAEPDRN
jgi:DNA-binding PadR family transcriptional regulator